MSGHIVVVIDFSVPRSTQRAQQLADGLQAAPDVAVFRRGEGGWRCHSDPEPLLAGPPDGPILIALVHGGLAERASLEPLQDRVQEVVYYTGGEPPEDIGDETWLTTPVNPGSQACRAEGLRELVDWARGNRGELPQLLRRTSQVEHLFALTLMCQAFLAGHSEPLGSVSDPVVAQALEEMGMRRLGTESDSLLATIRGHRTRIATPEWWREVFPDVEHVGRVIESEWGDDAIAPVASVRGLLTAIGEESPIKDTTVAAAYLSLAARLRR